MNLSTKQRFPLHILATCSLLAACAHRPVTPPTDFPAAPVDVTAPIPTPAKLPPQSTLRDVLKAGQADQQAIVILGAEVKTWREWWAREAELWRRK